MESRSLLLDPQPRRVNLTSPLTLTEERKGHAEVCVCVRVRACVPVCDSVNSTWKLQCSLSTDHNAVYPIIQSALSKLKPTDVLESTKSPFLHIYSTFETTKSLELYYPTNLLVFVVLLCTFPSAYFFLCTRTGKQCYWWFLCLFIFSPLSIQSFYYSVL